MRIAVIAVAVALWSSASHASPTCMTQAEARKQFGAKHLYWHGPNRCWDATPSRRILAQRAKGNEKANEKSEPRQVERDAPRVEKPPRAEKPPGWAHEPRWREAMSKMLPDDALRAPVSARASASSEPFELPPFRMNWRDRWVDVAQRAPPIVDKSEDKPEPADFTRAPGRDVEPLVTPTRVILTFLAVLLTLAVIEILFRVSNREWRS
jgi:hypothetical protein